MASAAVSLHIPGIRLVDLRELRGHDLGPILEEQTRFWRGKFQLDFSSSAATVRRFLDMRNLSGHALVRSGQAVGYSYFVRERSKVLIGEFYVLQDFRNSAAESLLLESTLQSAAMFPGVRRIEGQFPALESLPDTRAILDGPAAVYPRRFMLREGGGHLQAAAAAAPTARFSQWSDRRLDSAAELMSAAYADHVDSQINNQYHTVTGARQLLFNLTQHPGCGRFLQRASIVADGVRTQQLHGICLGSLVAGDVGHIMQLCVDSKMRGQGLGYELLRRSLLVFRDAGMRAVSLTVTAANHGAVRLYERTGFRTLQTFPAFVWESK